jgi:hypothetical protein
MFFIKLKMLKILQKKTSKFELFGIKNSNLFFCIIHLKLKFLFYFNLFLFLFFIFIFYLFVLFYFNSRFKFEKVTILHQNQ